MTKTKSMTWLMNWESRRLSFFHQIVPDFLDSCECGTYISQQCYVSLREPKRGKDCHTWGAGYTRIVAPSVAAWACPEQALWTLLSKPKQQKMAPQCVSGQSLNGKRQLAGLVTPLVSLPANIDISRCTRHLPTIWGTSPSPTTTLHARHKIVTGKNGMAEGIIEELI